MIFSSSSDNTKCPWQTLNKLLHSKSSSPLHPSSPHGNYPVSSRSRTLLVVLSFKLLSPVITPILRSLRWLRITERIEYKLLSLTYKVLTTTQPAYLHNLISVQRPRSIRSSSVVNLARPPSSSCLKITHRSFPYASHCLWNQLLLSLRQLHSGTSSPISDLFLHPPLFLFLFTTLLIHNSLSFTPG